MKHRPRLVFFALAFLLPELITGSTPVWGFLNPVSLIFLFIGYSIPLLIVREIAIRKRLDGAGIAALGLACGIFSEGLLAKTDILRTGLPVSAFDDYGFWGGISIPWTLSIGLWHAFASALFPLAVVDRLYPAERGRSWISAKKAWLVGTAAFLLASANYFGSMRFEGPPSGYIILVGLMGACAAFAYGRRDKAKPQADAPTPGWRPAWLGASVLAGELAVTIAAGKKAHPAIFFALLVGAVWFYRRKLAAKGWLGGSAFLLFALGFYMKQAFMGGLVGATAGGVEAVVRALTATAIILVLRRAAKKIINEKAALPESAAV